MTEQRLQEIEASIGRIECPECGGSGVYLDVPTGNEACDECDGSGMVSQFPPADELIAAVRRLTAERDEAEATIATLREELTLAMSERRGLIGLVRAELEGEDKAAEKVKLLPLAQQRMAENATLREQLQAAQADTERMDWLDGLADRTEYQNKRVGHRPVSSDMHFDYGRARLYVRNQEGRVVVSGEGTVREAIDAARVKQAHPTPAQEGQ